ncbi:MAG: hypothetical protein ABI678_27155 [Kofleriaceae bacterium]
MRALLGLAVLSGGCDVLFNIDHVNLADASHPPDVEPQVGDGHQASIAMTARGSQGSNTTGIKTLALHFDGGVAPALDDFTVAAVCYNHTNSAVVMEIADLHGHSLAPVRVAMTTNEYFELWAGHVDADLALTLSIPANFPDIRAISYSGVDSSMVPDTKVGTVMTALSVQAGPLLIAEKLTMVVAATCVQNQTTSLPDFVQETSANGNWISDRLVNGPDAVTAMAVQQNAGDAVLVLAALQAAE